MIRTLAAAALLAPLVAGVALASPATAKPGTSGCIDYHEFVTLQPGTMSEIQNAVDARGPVVHAQHHGAVEIRQYRWCDHFKSEGFFQISYYRNNRGQMVGQYVSMFDYTGNDPLQHQARTLA